MDIFIFIEFRKANSERLPRQLGSTPNGYGSRYLTRPIVCASLIKGESYEKSKAPKLKLATLETKRNLIAFLANTNSQNQNNSNKTRNINA
jgi:hypothetical protein